MIFVPTLGTFSFTTTRLLFSACIVILFSYFYTKTHINTNRTHQSFCKTYSNKFEECLLSQWHCGHIHRNFMMEDPLPPPTHTHTLLDIEETIFITTWCI